MACLSTTELPKEAQEWPECRFGGVVVSKKSKDWHHSLVHHTQNGMRWINAGLREVVSPWSIDKAGEEYKIDLLFDWIALCYLPAITEYIKAQASVFNAALIKEGSKVPEALTAARSAVVDRCGKLSPWKGQLLEVKDADMSVRMRRHVDFKEFVEDITRCVEKALSDEEAFYSHELKSREFTEPVAQQTMMSTLGAMGSAGKKVALPAMVYVLKISTGAEAANKFLLDCVPNCSRGSVVGAWMNTFLDGCLGRLKAFEDNKPWVSTAGGCSIL